MVYKTTIVFIFPKFIKPRKKITSPKIALITKINKAKKNNWFFEKNKIKKNEKVKTSKITNRQKKLFKFIKIDKRAKKKAIILIKILFWQRSA